MRNLSCRRAGLLAAAGFLMSSVVPLASGQTVPITVVGQTTVHMDAIAFNSSGTLYGATAGSLAAGSLYTINPATGVATLVGPLVGASNSALTYGLTGLAFQPGSGTLYGATSKNSGSSPNSLVTVDPATGKVTVIGPINIPTNQGPADLTFTPDGTLYGWIEADADGLATINLTTGQATLVGSSGYDTFGSGIASNAAGVLYYSGMGTADDLWTINRTTGNPTTVGTMSTGAGEGDSIGALAFSPGGTLYGIENPGGPTYLISIGTSAAPPPPTTPAPSTWLLLGLALASLGLYQARTRIWGSQRS